MTYNIYQIILLCSLSDLRWLFNICSSQEGQNLVLILVRAFSCDMQNILRKELKVWANNVAGFKRYQKNITIITLLLIKRLICGIWIIICKKSARLISILLANLCGSSWFRYFWLVCIFLCLFYVLLYFSWKNSTCMYYLEIVLYDKKHLFNVLLDFS